MTIHACASENPFVMGGGIPVASYISFFAVELRWWPGWVVRPRARPLDVFPPGPFFVHAEPAVVTG